MKKEMNKKYDYLVIGSGPAGFVSAITASQLGLKVAVVEKERDSFGGVCLNEGCIPLKSLIDSAKKFRTIKDNASVCMGKIECGGANLSGFAEKSKKDAEALKKGLYFLFRKNNIDLLIGEACFLDNNTVRVSEKGGSWRDVGAANFLIATGSKSKELPAFKCDGKYVITSSEAIRLDTVPEKILIVGAGAIGVEFASFFNSIGVNVTIVETENCLLPAADKEVSRRMGAIFKKDGINVITGGRVKHVSVKNERVTAEMEVESEVIKETYDIVLVSAGRVSSVSPDFLKNTDVRADEDGFIPVDEFTRTNVKNIYAAGDVIRTPMFAHTAQAEGELAARTVAGAPTEKIKYRLVPHVVYSEVQTASIGMTEEEARLKGIDIALGKQFFKSNGLALVKGETEGFIKIIADKNDHSILGVHIVGHNAAELIHEFIAAMKTRLPVDKLAEIIHAHPTFAETASDAARAVFGKAVHG